MFRIQIIHDEYLFATNEQNLSIAGGQHRELAIFLRNENEKLNLYREEWRVACDWNGQENYSNTNNKPTKRIEEEYQKAN